MYLDELSYDYSTYYFGEIDIAIGISQSSDIRQFKKSILGNILPLILTRMSKPTGKYSYKL